MYFGPDISGEDPMASKIRVLKLRRRTFFALVVALAATPAFGAANNAITGRWFTEGFEKGTHLQVILDIKPGGSYDKDIRVIGNCDIAASGKETGTWTFDGRSLGTVSETFDGKPATGSPSDTHNRFTVTRVDDEHINLFDTDTNIDWGLMLVSQSYLFPAPRNCGI